MRLSYTSDCVLKILSMFYQLDFQRNRFEIADIQG
jgi:hypothetical protein